MDTDFEMDQGYRYTVGQFMKLNHGLVKLPGDLSEIFSQYTMPECCHEQPYNNTKNIRFYVPGEKKVEPKRKPISLRRKGNIYDDSNILSELRHAFSSVVKGDGGTIHAIAKLTQTLIPQTMVQSVAKLFFDTIIQSPKQMPEYLKVLFSFSQPGCLERKVHYEFAKIVMNTFKDPPVLKNSPLESGEDRTRKHRASTCMLIASLFVYDYDPKHVPSHVKPHETFTNVERLRERILQPLIDEAQTNPNGIKNLANVWEILLTKPMYSKVLDEYKPELKKIYQNKDFRLTSRILLKDFCEDK